MSCIAPSKVRPSPLLLYFVTLLGQITGFHMVKYMT